MRIPRGLALLALPWWLVGAASAQVEQGAAGGPRLGPPQVQRWRVGMVVAASGGAISRLIGTTTVPMDWPEQRVKIVEQDLTPGVSVSYQTRSGGAKQMIVKIPGVASGKEARAILTLEIERRVQSPPENTDVYVVPDPQSLPAGFKDYLAPSPYIESGHARIKALARQLGADHEKAWDRVRAYYDWVRRTIQYEKDAPLTGVIEAIDKGTGDCNELTSALIALCRAGGIPARTVRIPRHCYPEFYLQDGKGQGYWFPCEASGSAAFGGVPGRAPILQKGDNFRISMLDARTKRTKTDSFRFLPESLVGMPRGGGGQPQMRLVCEPADN